jgi:hypothetical protein
MVCPLAIPILTVSGQVGGAQVQTCSVSCQPHAKSNLYIQLHLDKINVDL